MVGCITVRMPTHTKSNLFLFAAPIPELRASAVIVDAVATPVADSANGEPTVAAVLQVTPLADIAARGETPMADDGARGATPMVDDSALSYSSLVT